MADKKLVERAIKAIRDNAKGREVVMYGREPEIRSLMENEGITIEAVFSENKTLIMDKSLNCKDFLDMDNKSDKYYVVIPYFFQDGGKSQRTIMGKFGYKETQDFIFLESNITNLESKAKNPPKNEHDVYTELISNLGLEPNKKMAVLYYNSLGDFYSLCATIQYAEEQLGKEYILLYFSDIHEEILGWFNYDNYKINSCRIDKEAYMTIYNSPAETKSEFKDWVISWSFGDPIFRKLTCNTSDRFAEKLRRPNFPTFDLSPKYEEYVIPSKTVWIIPQSNALNPLPVWFWNLSARIFRYMGFSVVFNADSKKTNIYDGKAILPPISDAVNFANACGYVYGMRCGLMDVLSTTTAHMTIFSTKAYAPLDKVFRISNDDERIKTIFFENCDHFFKKSPIISDVIKYFERENSDIFALLRKNCQDDCKALSNLTAPQKINAYKYNVVHNKFPVAAIQYKIKPFDKTNYSIEIKNNKLLFAMPQLSHTEYRFDYIIFENDLQIASLKDFPSNSVSYPLTYSGEYHIKVTITNLKNYDQENFDTESVNYSVAIPSSPAELTQCIDLKAYIMGLLKLKSQIMILICSRDAHAPFKANKNSKVLDVLQLLGLQTDFGATCRYSYIGVIDEEKVITELLSDNKTLKYQCEIGGNIVSMESSGFHATLSDKTPIKIEINGNDLAVNKRGLNFVVWNKQSNTLIDSVAFDTFYDNHATRRTSPLPLAAPVSDTELQSEHARQLNEIYDVGKKLEKEIAELKLSLNEMQYLHSETDKLNAKNTQLEMLQHSLSAELERSRSKVTDLNSMIQKSENELQALRQLNKQLEDKVSTFENSRSWRITKPLRLIMSFFRKKSGRKP